MKKTFSLSLLILITFFFSCKENREVLIQGFENVSSVELKNIQIALKKSLPKYNFSISPENLKLPKSAHVKIKTSRYRADSLLRFLITHKPETIGHIIGITDKDISFTKKSADGNIKEPINRYKDWGIFGLATVPGKSCIISTFRIRCENKVRFKNRLNKICIHEFGHNLGLPHCPDNKCVMQDAAESIKTIDAVSGVFCNTCLKEIH